MRVTTDSEATYDITRMAAETCVSVDYFLMFEYESIGCLESTARRVICHHWAVEERLVWVSKEFCVVLAALFADKVGQVVVRRRHKCEDFARRRLYSHYAAYFVLHKHLSIRL